MKIAILSDIHGNFYALYEVIKELNRLEIEKILCLGDSIGYYYHPKKVLDILKQYDCEWIRGNHEEMLINLIDGEISENTIKQKYGDGLIIAKQVLSKEQIFFIRDLPISITLEIDSLKFNLNHGKRVENNLYGYIYPSSSKEDLEECCVPEIDFVFYGHSHYQFLYKGKHSTIINPGSIGQSRLKGGIANWCALNTQNGVVEFKSTIYNVQNLIDDIDAIGDEPDYIKQILLRNN